MIQIFVRRSVLSALALLGTLVLVFLLIRTVPGDPCRAIFEERATNKTCSEFAERNGLNKSTPDQFGVYVAHLAKIDLDDSLRYRRPVTDLIAERLPTTIELAAAAMSFAILLGVPLGTIAAHRHNTTFDTGTLLTAVLGVSIPVFLLGLVLAYTFGVILADTPLALPPSGRLSPGSDHEPFYLAWGLVENEREAGRLLVFLSRFNILNAMLTLNLDLMADAIRHLILPAVTAGMIPMAMILRITRSALLDVLSQDYVRTARAKGLLEVVIAVRHSLPNALLPVVTIIGLAFASLVSGAILTETIFGLAGVGSLLVDSIRSRDYPVVQGLTILTATTYLLVNTFVDVVYQSLDPRIRVR